MPTKERYERQPNYLICVILMNQTHWEGALDIDGMIFIDNEGAKSFHP